MVQKVDSDIENTINQNMGRYGQSISNEAKQGVYLFLTIKQGIIRKLRIRQSFLLATPQNTKNVAHFERDGDPVKMSKIDRDLEQVIKTLPYAAKDSIEQFIHDIRMNSILASSASGTKKIRAQRYFYGIPRLLTFFLSRSSRNRKDIFRRDASKSSGHTLLFDPIGL
jgi:hypothetical protein